MIVQVIILAVVVGILIWQNAVMTFKIGYYERTLELHQKLFSREQYKHIEKIKSKKSPFNLLK